jgi:hypothetical protein
MLGPIRRAFGELSAAAAADLYARSRYSRHDEAAGGLPNGPLFRRILGRAHSATPPGVLGSLQNRQRRGVESRFPPFLAARPGSTSRHLYGPTRRQHLRRARGNWKSARGPASSIDVSPIGCRRDEPCPIQRTRSAGLEHRLDHRALGNAGAREKAVDPTPPAASTHFEIPASHGNAVLAASMASTFVVNTRPK